LELANICQQSHVSVMGDNINIDQGHHAAKLALPTWAAKDSDNKVLITDQTQAKKVARHCCSHGPLIAQIGTFFIKLVPTSQLVTYPYQPVPSSWPVPSSSLLGSSSWCMSGFVHRSAGG